MPCKRLRAPAYPLITIDPYTSIWCMNDRLNEETTKHWTGHPNTIIGLADIDEKQTCFMGNARELGIPKMEQTGVTFDSFSTIFTFKQHGVELTAVFTSPLLPDDLMLLSRPVSYLRVSVRSLDGILHNVRIAVYVTEELCLNNKRCPVLTRTVKTAPGLTTIRIGGQEQAVLGKAEDNICIDWGYFYLSADGYSTVARRTIDGKYAIVTETALRTDIKPSVLILFAYDDIDSITYFGKHLKAYWKKDGQSIEQAIAVAYHEYGPLMERCRAFDKRMVEEAVGAGGDQYAQLLQLALRQVFAGHKMVLDQNGEILYISKECFSGGCASTVDVSYPSIPIFLLYNPELAKGMLRPIFRYAASPHWPFDFAPHDVGTYPILNGQVYSNGVEPQKQMPVEECGNMLIMVTAISVVERDTAFARKNRGALQKWANYLLQHGVDPEKQLCTDDFSGHLAHNCNLSIKSILALEGYSWLCRQWCDESAADLFQSAARNMANTWIRIAANGDGSTRLAFDLPGTFSMKYNLVWDKIFGTGLFPDAVIDNETESYAAHVNPYGLPLDNRADYTKSDWLVWAATLSRTKDQFENFIRPLWLAYNNTPSRFPMIDWYSTITSMTLGFQHRTVQGGLWVKLLEEKKICRLVDENSDKVLLKNVKSMKAVVCP